MVRNVKCTAFKKEKLNKSQNIPPWEKVEFNPWTFFHCPSFTVLVRLKMQKLNVTKLVYKLKIQVQVLRGIDYDTGDLFASLSEKKTSDG